MNQVAKSNLVQSKNAQVLWCEAFNHLTYIQIARGLSLISDTSVTVGLVIFEGFKFCSLGS